jgi:signal transduction histidine kinase
MSIKRLCAALLINVALVGAACAATPDQAKVLVDKALAYVKANGTEKAYKEFNTPGSQFFDGELYIFAYDVQGNNLALGGNPKMTGKNLLDMKSADGKFVIKDFIEIIKTKGEGWYDYKWSNPESKKIQDKSSYVKKIPGTDAFLGSGFYK